METASIQNIDEASLDDTHKNALRILTSLPLAEFNEIKSALKLGVPSVVGPQTLDAFISTYTRDPYKLDLSVSGVNAFKEARGIGNSGAYQGAIGPQTAQAYYDAIMSRARSRSSARAINDAGLQLIKSFEGYAQAVPGSTDVVAYLDAVGVPTIGYGHTGSDVHMGLRITQAQAEGLLQDDLARFENGVASCVTVPLTDNQFAALVSFAYNLGVGTLQESTLLRLLNSGDTTGAADQFLRFVYAGGQQLAGLVRRRQAERDLFLA